MNASQFSPQKSQQTIKLGTLKIREILEFVKPSGEQHQQIVYFFLSFLTIVNKCNKSNIFSLSKRIIAIVATVFKTSDIYFLYYTHLLTASFSQKYYCNTTSQLRQEYVKSKRNKYFTILQLRFGPSDNTGSPL